MDIYSYIDDYGIYTFSEKEFTEVDAVIFSFLSYANYEHIFEERTKVTMNEAGRMHLGYYPNKTKDIIAVKEGNKLLRYMKDTNRYKNCILYNYEYIGNDELQFGVISIEYEPGKVFVSFEGTNELFSGWKENFMLSYQFPTKTHKLAIAYMNKHFTFTKKSLIVGGHSKGGNLALISGMYSNSLVRNKITKIVGADSPGLLDEEFSSKKYKNIENKYLHIMPEYSFVGILLNNSNNLVVESTNKGPLGHSIIYWTVKEDHFIRKKLSPLSKSLGDEINNWARTHSDEEKWNVINNFEILLKKANISSIVEIKEEKRKLLDLIYESKDINSSTRKVLLDFLEIFIKCFNNVKKEELKLFLNQNLQKLKRNHEKEKI